MSWEIDNISMKHLTIRIIFQQMNVKRYNVFINTQGFLNSICQTYVVQSVRRAWNECDLEFPDIVFRFAQDIKEINQRKCGVAAIQLLLQ